MIEFWIVLTVPTLRCKEQVAFLYVFMCTCSCDMQAECSPDVAKELGLLAQAISDSKAVCLSAQFRAILSPGKQHILCKGMVPVSERITQEQQSVRRQPGRVPSSSERGGKKVSKYWQRYRQRKTRAWKGKLPWLWPRQKLIFLDTDETTASNAFSFFAPCIFGKTLFWMWWRRNGACVGSARRQESRLFGFLGKQLPLHEALRNTILFNADYCSPLLGILYVHQPVYCNHWRFCFSSLGTEGKVQRGFASPVAAVAGANWSGVVNVGEVPPEIWLAAVEGHSPARELVHLNYMACQM